MNYTSRCLRMAKVTSETLRNQAVAVRERSTYVDSTSNTTTTTTATAAAASNTVTFDDGLLQFHHGHNRFILSYWTPVNKLPLIMGTAVNTCDSQQQSEKLTENTSANNKKNECTMAIIDVNGEDVTARIAESSALGKLLGEEMKINLHLNEMTTLSMATDSINRCITWAQLNKKSKTCSTVTSLLEQERQSLLAQYEPMAHQFMSLVEKAENTASSKFKWGGLFLLSSQLGFFARLIWVDYSWDVMEPITWCVTYSMMVATFAYYIIYSQEFMLPLAEKRAVQMKLWKLVQAQQSTGQFDLRTFRRLRRKLVAIEASKDSTEKTAFDTLLKSGITG